MLKPLGLSLLVLADKDGERTASGIVLAQNENKDRPDSGVVQSVGEDVKRVAAGERILFRKYAPDEVEVEGQTFLVLSEEDVIAKFV